MTQRFILKQRGAAWLISFGNHRHSAGKPVRHQVQRETARVLQVMIKLTWSGAGSATVIPKRLGEE